MYAADTAYTRQTCPAPHTVQYRRMKGSKGYKSFDTTGHSTIEQTEIIKQITHDQICIVPYPAYREEQNSSMHRISNPNCTMQRQTQARITGNDAPHGNSNRHQMHANQHSGKRWPRQAASRRQPTETNDYNAQVSISHSNVEKSQNIVSTTPSANPKPYIEAHTHNRYVYTCICIL